MMELVKADSTPKERQVLINARLIQRMADALAGKITYFTLGLEDQCNAIQRKLSESQVPDPIDAQQWEHCSKMRNKLREYANVVLSIGSGCMGMAMNSVLNDYKEPDKWPLPLEPFVIDVDHDDEELVKMAEEQGE